MSCWLRWTRSAEEAVYGSQPAGVARRGRALRSWRAASGTLYRRLQVLLFGLEPRHLALRGLERATGFGVRPRSHSGPARTLQCLHDGLLPQCQHADARRRRDHRCRAGAGGRSDRGRGGVALPTQRGAVTLGADRGGAEDAALGSSTKANGRRCSPPRWPALERGDRGMTWRRLRLLRAAVLVTALIVTATRAGFAI